MGEVFGITKNRKGGEMMWVRNKMDVVVVHKEKNLRLQGRLTFRTLYKGDEK